MATLRTPLGPPPVVDGQIPARLQPAAADGVPSTLPALNIYHQLEDYKRRHTKQNREIIRENANRLLQTRSLNDEIDELHVKVLEERAARAALAEQLRKAKEELARLRNAAATDAISSILSAVPALKQLQRQLSSTTSSSPHRPRQGAGERPPIMEWPGRPIISELGKPELDAVTEGSESDGQSTYGGKGYGIARRRSRVSSERARLRSASPPMSTLAATTCSSKGSTLKLSPKVSAVDEVALRRSPRKVVVSKTLASESEPVTRPTAKGRRQSGLFMPRTASYSPEAESQIDTAGLVTSAAEPANVSAPAVVVPAPRRRRRSELAVLQDQVGAQLEEVAAQPTDMEVQGPVEGIDGVLGGTPKKKVDHMEKVDEADVEDGRTASTSSSSLTPLSSARSESPVPGVPSTDVGGGAGEAGADGRVRRARKSVNYREPSLHTKMRKPDGTPSTLTDAYVARPLEPVSQSTARSRSTTPLGSSIATPAKRNATPLSNRDPTTESRPESPTSDVKSDTSSKPVMEIGVPKTSMRPHSAAVQIKLDAAASIGSIRRKSVAPRMKRDVAAGVRDGAATGSSLRAETGRLSPVGSSEGSNHGPVIPATKPVSITRRASLSTNAARETASADATGPAAAMPRTAVSRADRRAPATSLLETKGAAKDELDVDARMPEDGVIGMRKGRRRSSMFQTADVNADER